VRGQQKLEARSATHHRVESGANGRPNRLVEDKLHSALEAEEARSPVEELAMLREARRLATKLAGGDAPNPTFIQSAGRALASQEDAKAGKIAAISADTESIFRGACDPAGSGEARQPIARTNSAGILGENREAMPTPPPSPGSGGGPNDKTLTTKGTRNWTGMTIWVTWARKAASRFTNGR
jgi:hypothetical protein